MTGFDVVVAGAGPAGSAAAHAAARAGLSVCLLDKRPFPRDKLCGGLLTERSRKVFEAGFGGRWDEALVGRCDRVAFRMGGRTLAEALGPWPLHFTMRRAFDAHLLGLAEAAGAELILGEEAVALDEGERTLRLASGRSLRFGHLVGADGVSSAIAKALYGAAFDPAAIGFGLEVEVPRGRLADRADLVEIDFAAASWGYGWVFPKRESFTIGVGGVHRRNPALRQALAEYLRSRGLDPEGYRVKGQYIPFGDCRAVPGRGRVLLCGDAAGFVDPITGEGIAYAMQSGAAAGQAIARALAAGQPETAFARYRGQVRPIVRAIGQARAWRRLIFSERARGLFGAVFARAGVLQGGFLDIMAGEKDYDDLPGLFALQAARGLLPRIGRPVLAHEPAVGVGAHHVDVRAGGDVVGMSRADLQVDGG